METVAPQTLVVIAARQCISVAHPGVAAMKSGVETADLDGIWKYVRGAFHGRDVIGLMQRRPGHIAAQLGEARVIEDMRLGKVRSAVRDAMADRRDTRSVGTGLHDIKDLAQGASMILHVDGVRGLCFVDGSYLQHRRAADVLHLTAQVDVEALPRSIERELDG